MLGLTWQAWMTIGVILAIIVALLRDLARPDLIFLGGLGLLLLVGVLPPEAAFTGFSNPAMLTVAALFVVAAGVQRTEALGFLDQLLFGGSKRLHRALPRLMLPTSCLSAFLNNTPIVAMLTPQVQQWAHRTGVPASKLLIPLSYASIVGGMVTLVGTSTNIIVSGLMQQAGYEGLAMFDLAWIGLPAAACVIGYFTLFGHRLLPDHSKEAPAFQDGLEDCLFEVRVAPKSPLVGQSVEQAGLRALGEAYLVHLRREGRLIPSMPEEVLQADDALTFTGNVKMLEELLERPGLDRAVPAIAQSPEQTLPLFEAVVASSSNLVGKTLREADFRDHYGGVVLAIQRRNERVEGPLGRAPIKAGDLLLVEARNGFDKRWNATRDEFYLVAPRRLEQRKPQPRKAPIALILLVGMIAVVAAGWVPLVTAAFATALGMILTRCLHGAEARGSVNVQVLVIIAAALGIGQAVELTGLAGVIAHGVIEGAAGWGVVLVLVALYLATNLLTELFTNNAAAALMVPIALAGATELGVDPKAFAVTVAIAASASFMTPIGYQTNLMVMAAGGYRFRDYFKAGAPVSLLVASIAITIIYWGWVR